MELIKIAESLHCHIPSVQASMRKWLSGDDTDRQAGDAHLIKIVKDQAAAGANYMDVNTDNFLTDPEYGRDGALRAMDHMYELVAAHGQGTPVCVDSSDTGLLEAGLGRYYEAMGKDAAPPLMNSISITRLEPLSLRKDTVFSVVGMLLEQAGGSIGFADIAGPEGYHETARHLFEKAREAGFAADEIFFDPTVGPLGADMVGYTRRTFEGIRLIRTDPEMAGAHICVGLSNCSDGLPRRVAVNRAYLRVAMEYGLDGAIMDVTKVTGKDKVAPSIEKLIREVLEADPMDALGIVVDFVQSERARKA